MSDVHKEQEIKEGDVWFVEFPFEEDPTQTSNRPVIVLNVDELKVLSVKVTKHSERKDDPYDTPILYWQEAKLKLKSTARVGKSYLLSKDAFIFKIGTLDTRDMDKITDVYIRYVMDTVEQNMDTSA